MSPKVGLKMGNSLAGSSDSGNAIPVAKAAFQPRHLYPHRRPWVQNLAVVLMKSWRRPALRDSRDLSTRLASRIRFTLVASHTDSRFNEKHCHGRLMNPTRIQA